MMNTSRKSVFYIMLILITAFTLIVWMGCRGSTETDDGDDDDEVDDDDDDDAGDDDSTPPDTTPPDPPWIDPAISPTYLDLQSITGVAEAGSRVDFTGGVAPVSTFAEADGVYCATVYLNEAEINTISVTATDASNNTSDPTTVQIEQMEPDEPSNESLDKAATASSISSGSPENTPDKAVDGDLGTQWDSSKGTSNPQWLKIYLDDFIQVEQIKIVWSGTENAYADKYEIRINPNQYSDTPPTADDWVPVYVENNGQGGIETFDLPTPFGGWWIALYLKHSVSGFPLYSEYEVVEFEAWGYPYTAVSYTHLRAHET